MPIYLVTSRKMEGKVLNKSFEIDLMIILKNCSNFIIYVRGKLWDSCRICSTYSYTRILYFLINTAWLYTNTPLIGSAAQFAYDLSWWTRGVPFSYISVTFHGDPLIIFGFPSVPYKLLFILELSRSSGQLRKWSWLKNKGSSFQ